MSGDSSTGTERDAGISAAFDAYDDRDLDRPSRADLEAEAEFWHDEYPYGWPPEASERVIAWLHEVCRECNGDGEYATERQIPADMFGPAEPIFASCPACGGTGRTETGDTP